MNNKRTIKTIVLVLGIVFAFLNIINYDLIDNQGISKRRNDFYDLTGIRSAASNISIITPENKTYYGPMSGYYPAVFGFENQISGATPDGWIIYQSSGAGYLNTIDELDGHKKVLDFYSGAIGDYCYFDKSLNKNVTSGTIEFWFRTTDVFPPEWYSWVMLSDGVSLSERNIRLCIRDGTLTFLNSTDYILVDTINPNQWYHLRIDFDMINDTSTIYLNNALKLANINNYGDGSQINMIHITNHYDLANTHIYLDAIGYSWDLSYNIGDNLNEGLLLSFTNTTELDWMAYSLDEQANKTILGNTTIRAQGGPHKLQVFGTDSIGTFYSSEVRHFTYYFEYFYPIGFPIYIDDADPNYNWSKTAAENPWCSGSGTWNDPYLIQYVRIDGNSITIRNSQTEYFIIRNCMVFNHGMIFDAGINLFNVNNGALVNNNCSNSQFNAHGISLGDCTNSTISGNIVNNNLNSGIMVGRSHNIIISGNTVIDNREWGIGLGESENNTISNNNVSGTQWYDGIGLVKSDNNTISGNIVNNNNLAGIYLLQCDNNTISRNTANNNNDCGIIFDECNNNTISRNTANNNWCGIEVHNYCDNNIIWGNILNYNNYGIRVTVESDESCNNNIISRNTIIANDLGWVLIENNCSDNLIYLNYFFGNGSASDMGNNQWDNGYAGNFWVDYSGSDSSPIDGIGDLPYNVFGSVYDTKPLMYLLWEDPDNDNLDCLEEYTLGYDGFRTNPVNSDTDDDSFNDGDEASCNTNPLDPLWYPMPNLIVSHFFAFFPSNETSFMLDFSITNNGIWKAEGVIIIVRCEALDLTLYNNTISPITLDVDETEYIAVINPPIEQTGTITLNVTVDLDNTIAETYSSKDGSARIDAENDNSKTAELTILPETINLIIISQSFSTDEFNITFFISDDKSQYIDFVSIKLWWNGMNVSTDVQNLDNGLYFISLEPLTIAPGEDPILLNMTISAVGYKDKHFEMYLAVDPETLEKRVGEGAGEFPIAIIITSTLIVGGIGAAGITFFLLRRRKRVSY